MGRPRTAKDLQYLADIAKAREAARKAAAVTAPLKPYKERPPKATLFVQSIEDDGIWVTFPIYQTSITSVTPAGVAALGLISVTQVAALPATSNKVVDFKGNNSDVLRVKIHDPKATPTERKTSWGTRVVDKIDRSYQVPMGVTGTDNSLDAAKKQFRTLFAVGGALRSTISKKGAYAELYHGKKLLTSVKGAAAAAT